MNTFVKSSKATKIIQLVKYDKVGKVEEPAAPDAQGTEA